MKIEKEISEVNGNIVKEGFICFFDILGYKNILENNTINKCAQIINNILLKLQEKVKSEFTDLSGKPKATRGFSSDDVKSLEEDRKSFFDNYLNIIMVSDSIVLFFDFTDSGIEIINHTWLALRYIATFQREAFIQGLPMRGCLDFGEYYYHNSLFAGQTIVNSYEKGNNLEFSGVVVTDDAYNRIKIISEQNDFYTKLLDCVIFRYLYPVKNGQDESGYIIKWYEECDFPENQDIRQFIYESFYWYNKNIDTATVTKINNTEKILRFFLLKCRTLSIRISTKKDGSATGKSPLME
ncbi:MAG: hypothetical protein LBT01_08715 [Spirochaetaceae bacterium]|nr:hypothetical protein [Spirochaetaceae bacterium]